MTIDRRRFLYRLGAAGGFGAAYSAMQALGLGQSEAWAAAPTPPEGQGRGTRVVVLGAGIAGLVAAYELERAGYEVTVLEARGRVGGRNWTLRDGDRVEMNGQPDQTVRFSDSLYFNAGPARIPSHHQLLLGYAKALGVPVEVEVNSSRGSLIAPSSGGAPILRQRQAINDTRGHISELLAKAIDKGALDDALTPEDKARLRPFLKAYGDLTADMRFEGTSRSGLAVLPGAGDQHEVKLDPVGLHDLLANEQLPQSLFEEAFDMQATMFEPVGGMDRIPAGFERALKSPIVRNAVVASIRRPDGGVEVVWRDRLTGAPHRLLADYAVVTIPFSVLRDVETDFAPPVKAAIASVAYDASCKTAFDAPRFWEADLIYGGISFVGGETSLVWYPSAGLHDERGVLVACYVSGPRGRAFSQKPIADQLAVSRVAVERLHPGHGADLTNGVAVNWDRIPFSLGPWPNWGGGPGGGEGDNGANPAYRLLNEPEGRVYFCGAQLSQMPGWQEGACYSARRTVAALGRRVAEAA